MMNKNLFLVLGMLAPAALLAQTRTSVANGNATNPFTWDCTCIPLPGNNIIINHAVVLDNNFAYTSGSVTINASGSLTGTMTDRIFGLSGGSFTNHGTLTVYNIFHSGGTFVNDGTVTATNGFAIGGTANLQNVNTFNVNDSLLIDASATLTNQGTTHAKYTLNAGTIANTGAFDGDDLYVSGALTNTTGTGIDLMNLYTSGTISNGSNLTISNDLWNSENLTNSNQIVIGHDLMNGDTIAGTATLTNNGTISVAHDLNNSETLNGSGSYCIANSSNNAGDVNGTLLICDQTGDNFDFNIGTIGGGVTYCTGGACLLGVNDEENADNTSVYPNPVSDQLQVIMNTSGLFRLTVFNAMGQAVGQQDFTGNRASIQTGALAPGVYLYRISGNGQVFTGKLVKE